jgi:4'-phosphopantetheinyl transferase
MIYFTDVTAFSAGETQFEKVLSPARKQRISSLKMPEDKQRSLVAELLLCFALKNEYPDTQLPPAYTYDGKGKPVYKDENIHISISHSGRFVACGISNSPIGIDVQQHKKDSIKAITKRLTKSQIQMIQSMPPKKQESAYFDFWCLKESLFKVNNSISIMQPTEFEFENLGGRLGISYEGLTLGNFSTVPGYSLGVCTDGPLPHCIFQVSAEKILSTINQQ